jgi:hydroxypyruvate isomerase
MRRTQKQVPDIVAWPLRAPGGSMPRYAANLSFLFTDLPFLDRFAAAGAAGFRGVEFMWPTATELDGRSVEQFGAQVRASGLAVALFNLAGVDPAAGMHGLAGVPARREAFRACVVEGIELAREIGCRRVNALAGNAMKGERREDQLDCLVENLAWAADEAAGAGVTFCVEALNAVDFPRYLLPGSAAAIDVLRRVGRANVRFQLDTYHLAMAGENPAAVADAHGTLVGHVQFADCPGRHEPGTGSVPFDAVLAALDRIGYDDWIGLEYRPTDPALRDFGFVERLLDGRLERTAQPAVVRTGASISLVARAERQQEESQ